MSCEGCFHAPENNPEISGLATKNFRIALEAELSDKSGMENSLKELVERRLQELGTNALQAAESVGAKKDFLQDILSERKFSVHASKVDLLAQAIQCDSTEVMAAMGKRPKQTQETTARKTKAEAYASPRHSTTPQNAQAVPVYGTAAGSTVRDVQGISVGSPIEYVAMPPALASVQGLYALYVTGDSMAPMHSAGELRFIHPHKPPRPGDTVIVTTQHHDGDPGQAYIKILERRTAERVVLQQINPPAEIEIPAQYVKQIHRVLTTNELFGL